MSNTEKDIATIKQEIADLQQDNKGTKEENEARFLALEREQVKGYDKLTVRILKFPILSSSTYALRVTNFSARWCSAGRACPRPPLERSSLI